MNLLPAVDLRSAIETVYSQSGTGACGPHAIVSTLEAMHDHAGVSKRFSRSWIYWWARVYLDYPALNIGTTVSSLQTTLMNNGLMLESEWPWDKRQVQPLVTTARITQVQLVNTNYADLDDLKRLLCLGIGVVMNIKFNRDSIALSGQRDWREHGWVPGGDTLIDHYVAVVGYDDSCGRVLCENSYGPGWGDGGFFGIPYDIFLNPHVNSGFSHVDRIPGFFPKPVEGFMAAPYSLGAVGSSAFVRSSKGALREQLVQALNAGGVQGLINECKLWGVSDKHLELLQQWDRGTVRKYQEGEPGLDWTGFIWDQV